MRRFCLFIALALVFSALTLSAGAETPAEARGRFGNVIDGGYMHTVGLKADGAVAAVGNSEDGQCGVDSWTHIVSVCTGSLFTVGLKADGTAVAVGNNGDDRCDVGSWTEIAMPGAVFGK